MQPYNCVQNTVLIKLGVLLWAEPFIIETTQILIVKNIRITFSFEPRRQKTGLRGFRPGPTQTGLYSHRRWLETWNFGFRKQRDCTIQVAKTKTLISFAVTAKLICVFVFAYAKIRFSHVAAHIETAQLKKKISITFCFNSKLKLYVIFSHVNGSKDTRFATVSSCAPVT